MVVVIIKLMVMLMILGWGIIKILRKEIEVIKIWGNQRKSTCRSGQSKSRVS